MRKVSVIGVGSTQYGKFPEKSIENLGVEAVLAAIKDANINCAKIEFAVCGNVYGGMCVGQRILKEVGMTNMEIVNVEDACASGGAAFRQVWYEIGTGLYDVGIAIGVEKMTDLLPGQLAPSGDDLEGVMGMLFPTYFALLMRRHMEKYGTTVEQVAKISVKNHHNGCLNTYSQYKKEYTLDEVLSSRPISDPITLLQCCPISDGAAAVILCANKIARQFSFKPIQIAASVLKTGGYRNKMEDICFSETTFEAAKEAYEMAGCGPEDIEACELHDAFAISELLHYEELGFCRKGEGGKLIDEGKTEIAGVIPVNPSGGLLSKGHPLAATGIAQIVEIVWQLRGEAGKRQIKNAKVGLAHVMGGQVADIEAGACTIHILRK